MDPWKLEILIKEIAKQCNVDPLLALAIAFVESGIKSEVVRYEARWQYLVTPKKYAKQLGISLDTEITLQMFSWSCLQVMGSNARILGYNGMLTLLIQPTLGILYGCKHIQMIQKKFTNESDLISAYNAGIAVKIEGKYRNQEYVNKVTERLRYLRGENGTIK